MRENDHADRDPETHGLSTEHDYRQVQSHAPESVQKHKTARHQG
jgi:hypothetical protein